jgi:hypothetical protein
METNELNRGQSTITASIKRIDDARRSGMIADGHSFVRSIAGVFNDAEKSVSYKSVQAILVATVASDIDHDALASRILFLVRHLTPVNSRHDSSSRAEARPANDRI